MAPTILYFDTSAAHCAAALLCDGTITVRIDEMARGQAEHLVPMLQEVLKDGGQQWSDLSAIAVGTGPGNFTGIRISVAAARGIALASGLRAIGVSGFETVAHLLRPSGETIICLPAPRNSAYVQPFKGQSPTGAARHITQSVQVGHCVGPAAQIAGGKSNSGFAAQDLAQAAVEIAERKLATTSSERPAPLYVRAADAAPSRDAAPVILP